ncbi:unnamed protein product [Cyprideis torosa]|uniref:Uncharacterized protein n=1 Tax=Cyprideis torosa TaxID=163714 RepID=A0A7R8WJH4_9CRUS|nr:unnamed protein product [Cyprideis torosa]CAG0895978.1 unnamed protein product [Cyprideis torosa]
MSRKSTNTDSHTGCTSGEFSLKNGEESLDADQDLNDRESFRESLLEEATVLYFHLNKLKQMLARQLENVQTLRTERDIKSLEVELEMREMKAMFTQSESSPTTVEVERIGNELLHQLTQLDIIHKALFDKVAKKKAELQLITDKNKNLARTVSSWNDLKTGRDLLHSLTTNPKSVHGRDVCFNDILMRANDATGQVVQGGLSAVLPPVPQELQEVHQDDGDEQKAGGDDLYAPALNPLRPPPPRHPGRQRGISSGTPSSFASSRSHFDAGCLLIPKCLCRQGKLTLRFTEIPSEESSVGVKKACFCFYLTIIIPFFSHPIFSVSHLLPAPPVAFDLRLDPSSIAEVGETPPPPKR